MWSLLIIKYTTVSELIRALLFTIAAIKRLLTSASIISSTASRVLIAIIIHNDIPEARITGYTLSINLNILGYKWSVVGLLHLMVVLNQ